MTGIDFRKYAIGKTMRECFPDVLESYLMDFYKGILVSQKPALLSDYPYTDKTLTEGNYKISGTPIGQDILVVFFENIINEKKPKKMYVLKKCK